MSKQAKILMDQNDKTTKTSLPEMNPAEAEGQTERGHLDSDQRKGKVEDANADFVIVTLKDKTSGEIYVDLIEGSRFPSMVEVIAALEAAKMYLVQCYLAENNEIEYTDEELMEALSDCVSGSIFKEMGKTFGN